MHYLTLQIYFWLSIFYVFGYSPIEEMDLSATSGRDAKLPCGSGDPILDGTADHISWFKNDVYLYRYPPIEEIRYPTTDQLLTQSCFTDYCRNDTSLVLKRVTRQDAGLYQCRLMYLNLYTGEYLINLTVVEPTGIPRIFDGKGDSVTLGFVGPYAIGSDIHLICQVTTGNIATDLYWIRNGVNVKYAPPPQSGVMQVEIHLKNITRAEMNVLYQCAAQNSDVSEPSVTNASIKIFTPPLSVELLIGDSKAISTFDLEVGYPRVVDCVVTGCMPHPVIIWYIGTRLIRHNSYKEYHEGNYTLSTLTLTPDIKYDGEELICSVYNSHIEDKVYEAKATLNVGYRPICKSKSTKIGAVNKEVESVTCTVEAHPAPTEFVWTFADGLTLKGDFAKVPDSHNRYVANLTWLPRVDDIGLLICRAANFYGNQTVPCMFNITAGGVPDVPNCDVRRTYPNSLRVRCIKGWDGGRPQIIHLDVYTQDGSRVENLTDADGTFFLPTVRFQSNLSAVTYSSNKRGKSKETTTYLKPLLPMNGKIGISPAPWVPYVQTGVTIFAVLSAVGILTVVIKIILASRVNNTDLNQIPDGIFHREPDFFREERLLRHAYYTRNRPEEHANEDYVVPTPPPPPSCCVLVDDSLSSSPDISSLHTYYV